MSYETFNIWQIIQTFPIDYTTALSVNSYLQTKDEYISINYEKHTILNWILTYGDLMDDIYECIEKK